MVAPRRGIELAIDTDKSALLDLRQPPWFRDALCAEPSVVARVGTDFVTAEDSKPAKARALAECGACLVRAACLDYAIASPELVGIWGGVDTSGRRAIRSNRARQAADRATA